MMFHPLFYHQNRGLDENGKGFYPLFGIRNPLRVLKFLSFPSNCYTKEPTKGFGPIAGGNINPILTVLG